MPRKNDPTVTKVPFQSTKPDFIEALAIADSLAKQFVENFPSKREEPKWRDYFRNYSVPGLRWLWKNGGLATRVTIAARIAVWRERAADDIKLLQERIRAREARREGGVL